jgi:RNA recognition motif-containing protein
MSQSPERERKEEDVPIRNGEREIPSSEERHGRSRDRSRERYDKRDKDPTSYTQIYIAKLGKRVREDELKEAFTKFGRIKDIVLKHTYAFIDYEDHEAANAAVKEMDGKPFAGGEDIVVEQSGRAKID